MSDEAGACRTRNQHENYRYRKRNRTFLSILRLLDVVKELVHVYR